ncbi:MAG: hypothetical protein ACK5JF_11100, partial [Oscillospiraceae bacterium]
MAQNVKDTNFVIGALYYLNSFLFALVLTCIIYLLKAYLGKVGSLIFSGYLAFFAQGLTNYAKSLYWSGWTFIFPLFMMLLAVKYLQKLKWQLRYAGYFLASFIGVLPRFLCSYEYSPSILISILVPIIFVCFKEKSRPLDGIISLASTAVGGASAFALSFAFYISKLQGVF